MQNNANLLLTAAFFALTLLFSPIARAQTAPDGWKTIHQADGVILYVPRGLKLDEVYAITVCDAAALNGKTLEEWLRQAAASDPFKPGTANGSFDVSKNNSAKAASGIQLFTLLGKRVFATHLAVSVDGENVRTIRIVTPENLIKRYQSETSVIVRAVTASLQTLQDEKAPVSVNANGLKLGGRIVEGIYVGDVVFVSGGEEIWRNHYRLSLYADGEYCARDENDKIMNVDYNDMVGHYHYNPATGKLDVRGSLNLDNGEDEDEFCYYGRDAAGKPTIQAGFGSGGQSATLRYAGPPTRPSPEAAKQKEAADDAEAKRYKWITAPGEGLKPGQIAGIYHFYDATLTPGWMGGQNTNVTEETYLLLTDGTLHKGLPVVPDQLDAALSRRKEPGAWGRWRRQGSKIVASWGGPFVPLKGDMALAGTPGMRLNGQWEAGSSHSDMRGSSYSLWGVTFTPDGRFVKNGSGGYGNSAFMQNGGEAAVNTFHDDTGSTVSVVGGGESAVDIRKHTPGADRSGSYSIRGYALTLHYNDGRTARMPFFFGDDSHKTLYFEGAQLGRDDRH